MFNKKKRYFKKKLQAVQNAIFDLEFKRFKTLEIREGIRKEYDNLRSRLEVLNTQIEKESAPKGLRETAIDEFKRLEDQKVILEKDIETKKNQMEGLDAEVNGLAASAENQATPGINHQLDAYRELAGMIKEYVKTEL